MLPGNPKPRNRWRWWLPISLASSATIAVVLASILSPTVQRTWYIAGLDSDTNSPQRRETALNWIIQNAYNPTTLDAVIAALPALSPTAAGQTYMALHQAHKHHATGVLQGLMLAHQNTDHETFFNLLRVLSEHGNFNHPAVLQATAARLKNATDPQFKQLFTLLDHHAAWTRTNIPIGPWLRPITRRAASSSPHARQHAATQLADLADTHQNSESNPHTQKIEQLLADLGRDADTAVRRGAWFALGAWSTRSQSANERFENFDAGNDPDLRRWAAAAKKQNTLARSVIQQNAPMPDFGESPDAPTLQQLWQLEHPPTPPTTTHPTTLDTFQIQEPEKLPPLQRILLARAVANPPARWLRQPLGHDDPYLRTLAAVVAAEHLPPDALRGLIASLLADIDPIFRQSGLHLATLIRSEHFFPDDAPGNSLQTEMLRLLNQHREDPDATCRWLAHQATPPPPNTNHLFTFQRALLQRDGLPQPVILTTLLAQNSPQAWNFLLGPAGLSDDRLLTLLDHHRFAWVLDALLPEDAPRFPLWVGRATQLQAIAHLRVWYARHRAG